MIFCRPVKARASRRASIVASVPELVNRTRSAEGISRCTICPQRSSSSLHAP